MSRSSAFDAIDDPADPAWSGHAVVLEDRMARRRRILRAGVAAAVLVAACVVFVVVGSNSSATSTASPLVQPGSFVSVPQSSEVANSDVPATPMAAPSSGSGWAPAQATRPAYSSERITGDASGVSALLMSRLDALAVDLGEPIEIVSGWRTRHEQTTLYRRYVAGTGNLAAVPGTSLHEVGRAADAYVGGRALAAVPGAVKLARLRGMHFPVPGEAWHVELIGDPLGSGRR